MRLLSQRNQWCRYVKDAANMCSLMTSNSLAETSRDLINTNNLALTATKAQLWSFVLLWTPQARCHFNGFVHPRIKSATMGFGWDRYLQIFIILYGWDTHRHILVRGFGRGMCLQTFTRGSRMCMVTDYFHSISMICELTLRLLAQIRAYVVPQIHAQIHCIEALQLQRESTSFAVAENYPTV